MSSSAAFPSSEAPLPPPPFWARWRHQLEQVWSRMAVRERWAVAVAMLLVGAWLMWSVLIQPAWRTLDKAPAELAALETQLQQLRRLSDESRELRSIAPVSSAQAAAALKAATERLGNKARLTLQGERATLTLKGIDTGLLRDWLSQARSAARIQPTEATLSRSAQGLSGNIVMNLAVGGGTPQ
jgi:general secretion pathway protein M